MAYLALCTWQWNWAFPSYSTGLHCKSSWFFCIVMCGSSVNSPWRNRLEEWHPGSLCQMTTSTVPRMPLLKSKTFQRLFTLKDFSKSCMNVSSMLQADWSLVAYHVIDTQYNSLSMCPHSTSSASYLSAHPHKRTQSGKQGQASSPGTPTPSCWHRFLKFFL